MSLSLLAGGTVELYSVHDVEQYTSRLLSCQLLFSKAISVFFYQNTRKFRDEMSPKYGLLRGREFEMKGKKMTI